MEAAAGIIAAVAVLVAIAWWRSQNKKRQIRNDPYAIEPCPNPHCARCRTYDKVNQRALRKLPWLDSDNNRVVRGVKLGRKQHHQSPSFERSDCSPAFGQYPTVLLIPGLTTRPNVTSLHQRDCDLLESNFAAIRDEFQQQTKNDLDWTTNDTPSFAAKWNVLHLLNQGQWIMENTRSFPHTTSIVQKLPGIMEQCLFGNVFFSRIVPGTVIEPHCGPTNARHRLHLTLQQHCDIQHQSICVRDSRLMWKVSKAFVFDDSLRHHVDKCQAERVVLIVDLYHPELTEGERQTLRNLYPSSRI